MKTLLTIALTTISILSFSQTDIIEMRSRNASLKTYERIDKVNDYEHVASNFGMSPMVDVKNAVLDSVKILSDSVAVMYTSNYCHQIPRFTQFQRIEELESNQNSKRTYGNPRIGDLWQPGADTVVNHPLFRNRHSLDSVKHIIDNDYNFNLPSDSIEFIGFDNSNGIQNQNEIQPVKINREKKNSFGWELLFMLISPILLVLGFSRYLIPN